MAPNGPNAISSLRGSCPVVKSYPQVSQNKASCRAGAPQCGQTRRGAAWAGDGVGADAGAEPSPIRAPHTSQ